MNLWTFVFLTVMLLVNVSCQQIINSLPNNLLSSSRLSNYKQQQQKLQQQYKQYISDIDKEDEDDGESNTSQEVTPTLMNILQNQILANDVIESNKHRTNNIKNKTENFKENFIKNFNLYKWLTKTRGHPAKIINHNDNIEDGLEQYDESDYDNSINNNEIDAINQDKRSALRSARMSRRSQKKKETGEGFLPSVSVGEFPGSISKLDDFFAQLNTNIKTLETTPNYHHISFDDVAYLENQIANNKKEYANDYYIKPSGTAAFLHAIRSYRPSQKIRGLVAMQPESYRGANFHDPNFLWQGLGK